MAQTVPHMAADSFRFSPHPFGCLMSFYERPMPTERREGEPPPSRQPPPEPSVVVHLTVEHAKALAYMVWRNLVQVELQEGVRYELPPELSSNLGIIPAEWRAFWYAEVPQSNGANPVPLAATNLVASPAS